MLIFAQRCLVNACGKKFAFREALLAGPPPYEWMISAIIAAGRHLDVTHNEQRSYRFRSRLVRLADYCPPPWLIDRVDVDVDIRSDATLVLARLHCQRNPAVAGDHPLVLDGDELETLSVAVDIAGAGHRCLHA